MDARSHGRTRLQAGPNHGASSAISIRTELVDVPYPSGRVWISAARTLSPFDQATTPALSAVTPNWLPTGALPSGSGRSCRAVASRRRLGDRPPRDLGLSIPPW